MGYFAEYMATLPGQDLDKLRRDQLSRIEVMRGSRVISYAARIAKLPVAADIGIAYDDVLPFQDLLNGLEGDRLTVILETPGGNGEVGRKLVEAMHRRFAFVEFLVPGIAMSTGTIMCMGGHEILMGPSSSLGPIDAQLTQQGKTYSADALIEGFEFIKEDVKNSGGVLNPVYIPLLHSISPGELQHARNALEFARATVTEWLTKYKFRDWAKDGVPVPHDVREATARRIATSLASQKRWHTHGRSLSISDLESEGLKITDFSADADLNDAVSRYQVLTRITFEASNAYKIYETSSSTIARRFNLPVTSLGNLPVPAAPTASAQVQVRCVKCGLEEPFQLDFQPNQPLEPGHKRFPNADEIPCSRCGNALNFKKIRTEIEKQVGAPAIAPQPSA